MPSFESVLWVIGIFVCFLDVPAIKVGGATLKAAYLIFPIIFALVMLRDHLMVNRKHALLGILFVVAVLPSVLLSTEMSTSIKFMLGVAACLMIMSSMYHLTRHLGIKSVRMLVWVYRATVILTIPLFVSRLQLRGHFTFYEPSYWAIALIPYYCIASHKILTGDKRGSAVDGVYILLAILISQSFSMVLWMVLSLVGMLFAMKMIRLKYVLMFVVGFCAFCVLAYQFNARTRIIFNTIRDISDVNAVFGLIVLIGGNRLQRVLVAYQAFRDHPIVGVGLGALKDFSDLHFRLEDFSIGGQSAMDFELNQPATNVFLELAAECGIIGLIAFLAILRFVFRESRNRPAALPFRVAVCMTMLSLMIESSYLRPYVWMLYGISLGISSLYAEMPASEQTGQLSISASVQKPAAI